MRSNTRAIAILAFTVATLASPNSNVFAMQQQDVARKIVAPIIVPLLLSTDAGPTPGVTSVTPPNGATSVDLDAIVSATFSKTMLNASVNNTTFKLSKGGVSVPATATLDDVNKQAKLGTDRTLSLLTQYTATLTAGVTDLSGTPLPETSWSFTSRDGSWLSAERKVDNNEVGGTANARIAASANGDAFAIWDQYDDAASRYDIWSNRYLLGIGWEGPKLVETDAAIDAVSPAIAANASGAAIAVWTYKDLEDDLWSSHYVPGSGWDAAVLIETIDNGYPTSDQQVVMDNNGNAIAIWYQSDGFYVSILWNRYTVGVGWGTAQPLETKDVDIDGATISMDANGNAIAVWVETNNNFVSEVWSRRYVPAGGWQAPQLLETDNANEAYEPDIAFDVNGNAVAIWVAYDGNLTSIWANRYTSGGSWGGAQIAVQGDFNFDAYDPKIAMDDSGDAVAVWKQYDAVGNGDNIGSARYVPGAGWDGAVVINAPVGSSDSPEVAVDHSGNAVAVWHQADGGNDILASRYVAGGGWSGPVAIETAGGSAFGPQIAVDGFGNMHSVWIQNDGTRNAIFANRFAGAGEPSAALIANIVFSDPLLGDCVRAAAAANSWHFAQEVTAINCSNRGIRSLGGLNTFVNLRSLDVSGNLLDNMDVVERMPDLQQLYISDLPDLNSIDALAFGGQLVQVNLTGSGNGALDCRILNDLAANGVSVLGNPACRQRVADVVVSDTVLQSCIVQAAARENAIFVDELKFLDCERANGLGLILQLSGIEVFENLEAVNIDRSQVSDLTPLAGLTHLRRLDASSTYVSDLSPLLSAPGLEVLIARSVPSLYQGDPTGISILSSMPSLREAYLDQKDYCQGEPQCVTGGGDLDCESLDALEASLGVFARPQSCNMPIANVVMPDPALRACVASFVSGIANPHTNDVTLLDCYNKGITQLDGLERFGRLEVLRISENPIQDLSPLNSIYVLKELSIINSDIVDFYGLSNLVELTNLYAANIPSLVDIRELITMPRLTKVWLSNSGNGTITCDEVERVRQIAESAPLYGLPGDIIFSDFRAPMCDVAGVAENADDRSTDMGGGGAPAGADDLVLEYVPADADVLTSNWAPAISFGSTFGIGFNLSGYSAANYSRARAVAMADANGDFLDDLLLQLDSAVDDSVEWYVRLADGGSGWGAAFGPITMAEGQINNAKAIAFSDVNGDDYADVLISYQYSTSPGTPSERSYVVYAVSMGTGSGFGPLNLLYTFDLETEGRPYIAALEDVNDDGTADLVFDLQRVIEERELSHCFIVRTYVPGVGFGPISGANTCYKVSVDPRVELKGSVADIDGNGRKELVLSARHRNASGVGDWGIGFSALFLDERQGDPAWTNLTELSGAGVSTGFNSSIEHTYRSVAVADLNGDLRADMLVEDTWRGGFKNWIVFLASVDGNGLPVFEPQNNWLPGLSLSDSHDYRLLGLRDYSGDAGDLPDLLFVKTDEFAGTVGLHVAVNNGSSFAFPVSWHEDTVPAGVIGLEEDGLTNLANDTSELIAWVGDSQLRTFKELSLKLEIEKGWKLIRGPELELNIPEPRENDPQFKEGYCVLNYSSASGKLTSTPEMSQIEGKAQFGLMMCSVKGFDGRIELKFQAVYGGCTASVSTTGLGGGKCEAGTVRVDMKFDMTPPYPVDQIPVEVTVMARGPAAEACGAISLRNSCLSAEATLAEASYKTEVAGLGAGGAVGIGVGGSADFGIQNGVISASFGAKLGIGGEVNFSVDPVKSWKTVVRVGEDGYTFGRSGTKFVVFTAGPAVYDAASDIGGAVIDTAGNAGKVARMAAGDAVHFYDDATGTGKKAFIIFVANPEAAIDALIEELEAIISGTPGTLSGAIVSLGSSISSGAGKIWDFFFG